MTGSRRRLEARRGGGAPAVGAIAVPEQHGQLLSTLGVDAREAWQLDAADSDRPFDFRAGHRHGSRRLAEYLDGDKRDVSLRGRPGDVGYPTWRTCVSRDPTASEPPLLRSPDEQLVARTHTERCWGVRAEERGSLADLPVIPLLEGDRSDPMRHSSTPSSVRSG